MADVLKAQAELVRPEVGKVVVRPLAAEESMRDRRRLAGGRRPVLDADVARRRGPPCARNVAARVDVDESRPTAGVGGDSSAVSAEELPRGLGADGDERHVARDLGAVGERTPLTALRLRLENLEAEVPSSGRPSLEGAVAEVERLSRLVEGLLALARSDASEETGERLDLGRLVESRAEAWSALAGERGVRLETSQDGPAIVRAAPARVEQVLDNLLANALEVSPEDGTIRLGTSRGRGRVELHVVDEGPGLSAEERERAFDRFWRGRGSGEGSGLGLAIVKRLVAADDGRVELRAAAPRGIDAVVELHPS